jgi:hypothetical protein
MIDKKLEKIEIKKKQSFNYQKPLDKIEEDIGFEDEPGYPNNYIVKQRDEELARTNSLNVENMKIPDPPIP